MVKYWLSSLCILLNCCVHKSFIHVGQPFLQLRLRDFRAFSTNNVAYNALNEDKNLKKLVDNVKTKLSNVSTREIRQELSFLGVSSQSYYERAELVQLLAETRVVMDIKNKQEKQEKVKQQSTMATQIKDEIAIITSQLSFEDICDELIRKFNIPAESLTSDEAVRTLAIARLKLYPLEHVHSDEGNTDLLSGFKSVFQNFTGSLFDSKEVVGGVVKEGVSSIMDIAGRYEMGGYTDSEKEAIDRLNDGTMSRGGSSIFNEDIDKINISTEAADIRPGKIKSNKSRVKALTDSIEIDIFKTILRRAKHSLSPLLKLRSMDSVRSFLNVGVNLSRRLANWAGGSDLDPGQTLFISCAGCILLRRGVLTFLGSLLVVRLLRIAFGSNLERGEDEEEQQRRDDDEAYVSASSTSFI